MKVDTMLYGRVTYMVLVGCLLSACNATKHEAANPAEQEQKQKDPMTTKTTPQGLQITELKAPPANAAKPQKGQLVTVHYTGYLMDGQGQKGAKFDSSHDRNEPFSFPVGEGRVIQGWDDGLQQMAKGGTYSIVIPSNMGYGARGAGAKIPPHATLIFDIDVLDIQGSAAKDLIITELKAAPAGAPKPKIGQLVTVHYSGYLMDKQGQKGLKFDSSHDRNDPFIFPVGIGHVIRGWDQGIQQMAKGGTYSIVIPSDMGYGARGAGAKIPPHATLIFDIELLDVQGN